MKDTTPRTRGRANSARGVLKRVGIGVASAAVVALVLVTSPVISAAANPDDGSAAEGRLQPDPSQQRLDALVAADNGYYPGALAAVSADGQRPRDYTAGVGDLTTGVAVPEDGEVRIGSNTKTFTAVTVLQLVGEGRIGLDEPIDTYLPGLVREEGIDGRLVTVRQVLQHTSGLPNYTFFLQEGLLPFQHSYKGPRELLDLGLSKPASFAPGTNWEYSNTNFLVAGLIVEAVTDRPLAEQITKRVIEPLGLEHTYFPGVGDQTIHGPHPHAYHNDDPAQPLTDVTEQDPSFGWAAGQMVSTPSEVNRFFIALLNGELLAPEQLQQMRTTVPTEGYGEGVEYGLGLISFPVSWGGISWGHGGSITGYSTTNAATDDGRAATIATTRLPQSQAQIDALQLAVDAELCRQ